MKLYPVQLIPLNLFRNYTFIYIVQLRLTISGATLYLVQQYIHLTLFRNYTKPCSVAVLSARCGSISVSVHIT